MRISGGRVVCGFERVRHGRGGDESGAAGDGGDCRSMEGLGFFPLRTSVNSFFKLFVKVGEIIDILDYRIDKRLKILCIVPRNVVSSGWRRDCGRRAVVDPNCASDHQLFSLRAAV